MKTTVCLTVILAALSTTVALAQAEPAMPDSIVRVGACATPGIAWGVFVQGDYAYIADYNHFTVVDVSVPATPTAVGSLFHPLHTGVLGSTVKDTIAYLNSFLSGEFVEVGVSDPVLPDILGFCLVYSGAGIDAKGIGTKNDLAYIALGSTGFEVINTVPSMSPAPLDTFDTPGIAIDLCVRDTLAYIADYDSLQVVGIADSTDVYRVGAVAMPNSCYDVFVVDTFAYVACRSGFGFGSLEVINVSDPSSPQIVASVDNIVGDPLDVWISGNYAYVAVADYSPVEGGVRAVDISDPLSPSLVASYDTPGDPRGIFAVGDLVFVADYDSLQILRHIVVGVEESAPARNKEQQLRLLQNEPNPFSDRTSISYQLPVDARVLLSVHDVCGRLIASLVDEQQHAGFHTLHWNGKSEDGTTLPSGVYFYRLTAQGSKRCGKMILLR